MIRLALRSLSARRTAFTACALSVLLGAIVLLAFFSLLETAGGEGVSSKDQNTLVTMASVVGGWGFVIVVFSVASTLGIAVRARSEELALLHTIGMTRRQLRRMVLRETLAVALVSTLLAILPGWLLGRLVLALIRRADMVEATVRHRIGVLSIGVTVAAMLLATELAAVIAARRATRGSSQSAMAEARTEQAQARPGRWRITLGVLFLAVGVTYSTLTLTVMAGRDDLYAAMQTAGPACVFTSLGLAVLASSLIRASAVALGWLIARSRVSGYLALFNTRHRPQQSGAVLAPVIVFVGMSTGTLYLMSIQNAVTAASGPDVDANSIALLNYVVVVMISVFAAIMVVNTLAAVIAERRREFAEQRLTGATGRQLTGMITYEGVLVVVAGAIFGGLASLATVIPYSVVKQHRLLPDSPGLYAAVCAAALVVTLGTAVLLGRRAVRVPALDAAAGL